MRGRKPTPSALKIARGNPGRRPLNDDEPTPEAGAPEAPDWFDDDTRAHWDDTVADLERNGLMTKIDRDALVAYCVVYLRWKRAEIAILKYGQVIRTPVKKDRKGKVISGGYPVQSPYIGIANKALSQVRAYEQEFGMTPSSRSRVKVAKSKTTADKQRERFFGLRGGRVAGI